MPADLVQFESEELSDPAVIAALVADGRRGVACDVVMQRQTTWDSAFDTLAAAGCTVRPYTTGTGPVYIHTKVIVVDAGSSGSRAFVGSENASVASLNYDRELGIVLSAARAPSLVGCVASACDRDLAGGVPRR